MRARRSRSGGGADQSAFFCTHGTVSIALKSLFRSAASLTYVSISRLYVSEWMFSIAIWKP